MFQVERLFGEKRKLILPIILDIANVVRSALNDHQINERKYGTIKKRHRRTIEHAKSGDTQISNTNNIINDNEVNPNARHTRQKRQRKSADYFSYSHQSDILAPQNMSASNDINNDDVMTNDHADPNLDNFVHVTLPLYTNRTVSMEEYEDLALNELNGTEFSDEFGDENSLKYNESLPQPAKLLSNRYRIPIRRPPMQHNLRKCELFDSLCLRVDDYPV